MIQGTGDNFYQQGQLLPENFLKAARDAGYDEVQVRVRSQEGYDHSYYFVSGYRLYLLLIDTPDFLVCRCRLLVPITYTVSMEILLFGAWLMFTNGQFTPIS